ncbi:hypothetical protein PMZ80_002983 [Knufia obscura]|uniref:Xylanolytic transcriptional activator regulatory domain-containing protein n=2 Tax=Knufia TaxID=430999 RepID=A0AAN8ILR6_9EURO|nr:hypothetical protein PMZ80_002983 [Knufia obscura]KAK5952432.1 hypothetical protein OHC33_006475 [Knufia fluminis]
MAQALQLNLEYSTDLFHDEPNNGPTVCSKEARRRLMWSCYISDTLIGSGVSMLTLLDENDIKIQLPCNERNFVLQVPCVTEMLPLGQFLPFVAPEQIPPRAIDNIGIVALYVRLISLRKRVLKYVKRLDSSQPPWLPESEFARLDSALHEWYQQLPPSLQFTRAALYTRRESSQLGAFVLLQCTYNWTTIDLYRIALPKLYRLRPPWDCSDDFRARLQETIFVHAQRCSTVLADASRHGIKTLADTWLPSIAFDGNRLMLYYITQIIGLDTDKGQLALAECMPYCRSNLELLNSMQSLSAMAESLYPTADEMLKKASSIQQATRAQALERFGHEGRTRTREATPDHNGPDYVLQPTSVYRMARDSIATQEKHASEKSRAQRLRNQAASSIPPSSTVVSPSNMQAPSQYSAASRAQPPPTFSAWTSPSVPAAGTTPTFQRDSLLQLEPTAPAMHEFDTFFSSTTGFDGSWQPAETASAGFDTGGLPPWLPAMTDMYADLNFGPWPMGSDVMNGHPGPTAPM